MFNLRAGLVVVWRPDNALNRVHEDQVRQLVRRQKRSEECPSIHGEDQDFFYSGVQQTRLALVGEEGSADKLSPNVDKRNLLLM